MTDRALAATTIATVAVLTGHTTGCGCDDCERLAYVGLPDAVEALMTSEAERAKTQEMAHLRGFEIGREWRP